MPETPGSWDYIVVGGGSAGCVVAAELARSAPGRVLLLERGDAAEANPETLAADGYKYAFVNDRLMLERFTVPQPECGNRRLFAGTGMGMGGSGSVNGMVYTRGAALDYEEWPEGWRWRDVVPDFEEIERKLRPRPRPATAFTEACIDAAEAAGFSRKDDLNDGALCGYLGYEAMNYEGAGRRSSYVSFVKDADPAHRPEVVTGAHARRILVENDGGGPRAVGVEYEVGGEMRTARCAREVVLAAGALETPRLLLLSGIGPAGSLRPLGIDVVLDSPEIGKNLHDHPNVTMFHVGKRETDCHYPQLYGFYRANPRLPLPEAQADTCYVFYTARSSFHQAAMRMIPAILLPEWLHRISPIKRALRRLVDGVLSIPPLARFLLRLYGIVIILGKPQSRGSVTLRSRDPKDPALIDPRYFDDPRDLETMVAGVRLARRVAAAPALAEFGNRELGPGPRKKTDESIARWIRKGVMTTYHFAGTCKMGERPEDPVDTRLRLRGVAGIRVADASAVPSVPVSAMNAPSMLIGYRAARYIREDR